MPVCIRCNTNVGLFSFRSHSKQTGRNRLKDAAARDNLDLNEALDYARPDVVELIRRGIEIATKDSIITDHEEKYILNPA